MVRIVLGITTKNDDVILSERLSDLGPLIDGFVLCDCSTNTATRDVAQSFLDRTRLPGKIITTTFQGRFDTLNNLLFNGAKTLIYEQGFSPEETYGLFLDDASVSVYLSYDHTTIKENLDLPAYSIDRRSWDTHYTMKILLRMDYDWQSMGWISCQYWDCNTSVPKIVTDLLRLSDSPKIPKG